MKYKPSSIVTANGIEQTLTQFAEQLGCPVQTILGRLSRGISLDEAVTKPISGHGGHSRGTRYDADVLVGDEVQKILAANNQGEIAVRDRAFIAVAYRAGLRCFEILALKIKDLDLDKCTIRVHHGKGDKFRMVAIDLQGAEKLREWLTIRSTWGVKPDSLFFCTKKGTPIAARQMRAMMQRRGKAAGIDKRVHAHGLRRTMASEMAAEGVPLLDISGALGHSNAATTNTYLKKINPVSVIDAMRNRSWGSQAAGSAPASPPAGSRPGLASPDWLERLKVDVGSRLRVCSDLRRTDTQDFELILIMV